MAVALSFLCMTIVRLKYAWKHINMFDIKYFSAVMLVYVGYIVVNYLDLGIMIELLSFMTSLVIIVFMSKREIKTVKEKIIKRK